MGRTLLEHMIRELRDAHDLCSFVSEFKVYVEARHDTIQSILRGVIHSLNQELLKIKE